jgi:hypothetical protein
MKKISQYFMYGIVIPYDKNKEIVEGFNDLNKYDNDIHGIFCA